MRLLLLRSNWRTRTSRSTMRLQIAPPENNNRYNIQKERGGCAPPRSVFAINKTSTITTPRGIKP